MGMARFALSPFVSVWELIQNTASAKPNVIDYHVKGAVVQYGLEGQVTG